MCQGGALEQYHIAYDKVIPDGTVRVDRETAALNNIVNISVLTDARKIVESIEYTYTIDGETKTDKASMRGSGGYFYMPAADVTLTVNMTDGGPQKIYHEVASFDEVGEGKYLLVAEDTADGKLYALAGAGGKCITWPVEIADALLYGYEESANVVATGYEPMVWSCSATGIAGNSTGKIDISGSSGLRLNSGGRTLNYTTDADTDFPAKKIYSGGSAGNLFIVCNNGTFSLTSDPEAASSFRLFCDLTVEPVTYSRLDTSAELTLGENYLLVVQDGEDRYAINYATDYLENFGEYAVLALTKLVPEGENEQIYLDKEDHVVVTKDAFKWLFAAQEDAGPGWLQNVYRDTEFFSMYHWDDYGGGFGTGYAASIMTTDTMGEDGNAAVEAAYENGKLVSSYPANYTNPRGMANAKLYLDLVKDSDGNLSVTAVESAADACDVALYGVYVKPDPMEFQEVSDMEEDGEYIILTVDGGKAYAMSYNGDFSAEIVELDEGNGKIIVNNKNTTWKYTDGKFLSVTDNNTYLYPYSGGMTFDGTGRDMSLDGTKLKGASSNPYYITFSNGEFYWVRGNSAEACDIRIFKKLPPPFKEVSSFREDKKYILIGEDNTTGKLYAIGDPKTTETSAAILIYEISPDVIVDGAGMLDGLGNDMAGTSVYRTEDDTLIWQYAADGSLRSVNDSAYALYPTNVWKGYSRVFHFDAANSWLTYDSSGGATNYMCVNDGKLSTSKNNSTPASTFRIFELVEEEPQPDVTYNVTYHANYPGGGTVTKQKYDKEDYTLTNEPFARAGYRLASWNLLSSGSGSSYAPGDIYKTDADVDFYAMWTPSGKTITYKANYPIGLNPADFSEDMGNVSLMPYTLRAPQNCGFFCDGYRLIGWNTRWSGTGTTYAVGDSYEADAPLTLYAIWTRVALQDLQVPKNTGGTGYTGDDSGSDSDGTTGEEKPVGSFDNFTTKQTYQGYSDVEEGKWYEQEGVLQTVTELGLMSGDGDGGFRPEDSIRYREIIKLAAVISSTYGGDGFAFDQSQGDNWYDCYVSYLASAQIINADEFQELASNATRASVAYLLAKCLPEEALEPINDLSYDDIPDVDGSGPYDAYILRLYRAGVLQGSDERGTFYGETEITRAEIAALVVRLTNPARRIKK